MGAGELTALVRRSLAVFPAPESLFARADLRIIDRPERFSLGVAAEIALREPNDLRIVATKLAGKIQAFDAAILGERVVLHVPREEVYYAGTTDDLARAVGAFDPGEAMGQVLRPERHLLGRRWRLREVVGKRERHRRKRLFRLEEVAPAGGSRWHIEIEDETWYLMEAVEIDEDGDVLLHRTYTSYRPLRGGATAPGAGEAMPGVEKAFPYRVVVAWPYLTRSVAVRFKEIELNAGFDEATFRLEPPRDGKTTVLPIGDARIESDGP
jgi:hypothetical protein